MLGTCSKCYEKKKAEEKWLKKRGTDGKKEMTLEQRPGGGGKLSIQITEGKGSQSGGPQAARVWRK